MSDSLADQAYQAIKRDIITCELEPGAPIAQPRLVEQYGLGVTPIREALQRLAQEGYVQSIPRFGYVITPLTVSDVQEIYELRLALETTAVRLAAERGSSTALAEIRERAGFSYVYHDRGSYREFLAQNTRFHADLALLSGNRRLAESISRLLDEMARIFHLGLELKDSADEMRREHMELADALTRRDAAQAETLTRAQIEQSQRRVLQALNENAARTTQILPKR